MTVSELVKKLQQIPNQNLQVVVDISFEMQMKDCRKLVETVRDRGTAVELK